MTIRNQFNMFLLVFILTGNLLHGQVWDETHIPADHSHNNRNCHGYAMGRAFGKTTGDAFCDPVNTIHSNIDPSYFSLVSDPTLSEIEAGDIVSWGSSHSAYVVSVPSPLYDICEIRVDQVPNTSGLEQTNITLGNVMYIQDYYEPIGYYKGFGYKIRFTYLNSFDSGILQEKEISKPNWIERDHGESILNSRTSTIEIKAIDNQEYPQNYLQRYQSWKRDDIDIGSQNPVTESVNCSRTFEAVFVKEFNVTINNDFCDTGGGGQIKVADSLRNAPLVAKVLKDVPNLTVEAINGQSMNGFVYDFKQWHNGVTNNPYTFTINDHTSITAIFKQQIHLELCGPTFLFPTVQGTFTANPTSGTETYTGYRWWERNDGGDVPKGIKAPPQGQWIEQTGWSGQKSVTISRTYSFSLKCEVTDSNNDTAEDIHSVTVGGMKDKTDDNGLENDLQIYVPKDVILSSNYPNPFNPSTTIKLGLPEDGQVRLSVYSINGQKIIDLADGYYSKGFHEVRWNGTNLSGSAVSNGVYIYELQTDNQRLTKKMILAR